MSVTRALLPFVALVVGFVAGAGFGVVVLSGDAPEREAPAAYDSAARHGADGDRPSGDAESREGSRRRGVSTDDVLVENALRGGGGVPATTGDGVIKGTVLDVLGKPVADVQITATTDIWSLSAPVPGMDASDDDTLEARIRRLVVEHRFREATTRRATTAADGTYRLEGLVSASYDLEPQLTGWRFTATGDGDWSAAPGETCNFVAHPVFGVSVSVRLPDGSVPETADVWFGVTGTGSTESHSWTPDAEPLELGVGLYTFSASAGPHAEYAVNGVAVEIAEDGQATVDLRLAPRPGIVGKVEFTGEERPLSVGVAALPLDGGGSADESRLLSAPHSSWGSDPFDFALLDLPPGAYLVGAVLRNGTVLGSAVVDVSDAPVVHDFTVGNVDVRDYVVVRAHAPDGSPVTDATFVVGYQADDGTSFSGNLSLEAEEDGSYRIPVAVPGGPQDGYNGWSGSGDTGSGSHPGLVHFITATSGRFGTQRVDYDPAADRELDVRFSEPAFAVVTVAGYATSSWRGRVEATLLPAGERFFGSSWIDDSQRRMTPQGVARVGPVAPGSYSLGLMVLTEQNGYRRVISQDVVLGVGDTQVTMSLPDLNDLVVIVDGEPLDLDLHRDPGPDESTDFLDEGVMDGTRTTFSALAPGRYRVRHYGEGSSGEMLVDVPAPGPVRFRPVPYDSLRVEAVPDGLQGVLQRGDVITGIGGQPMQGERRVRAALALAGTSETVSLTVHRGSRSMEIEVPSAQLEMGALAYWVR